MSYLIASLVSLGVILCWLITLLGLPGNWIMIGLCFLVYSLVSPESVADIPWSVLVGLVLVAGLGEAIEFFAGAASVNQQGGARRSAILALIGSVVGAVLGLFVGLPIPIIGSLVGSILFSGLGACGGAVLGERWIGRDWGSSVQIGLSAFWGRLLGTLGKAFCGAVMMVIVLVTVWT